MQARVFGVVTAAVLAAMPVGALLGGSLVDAIGLRPALLVGGAAYLLVTVGPFVFPAWRQLDRGNGHTVSRREVENGAAAPTQS